MKKLLQFYLQSVLYLQHKKGLFLSDTIGYKRRVECIYS